MKKLALKFEGKQPIEKKNAQLSTGDALPEEKTSSSVQDIQMAPQQQPLKYKKGGNKKRMYQKAFITRMSTHSFSSMLAQLNEAQAEAVKSIGFASFLKVDLKQIPGKFSRWLVNSFDPYSTSFVLLDGQRFMVTSFDAYVTLDVPIGGREIIESSRSRNGIEHAALELTHMPEFILAKKDGGKSFKRNFIIYLRVEEPLLQQVHPQYVKDVNQIASLDWCKFVAQKLITSVRHYRESKSAKGVYFDCLLFFLMVSFTTQ
ncbi:hypothetical protein Cgig2_025808 [Carnegiea gigantea]|uniref:Uncharacterized protein n=1 Tax=Carnegiea gigantea TaxID=171969 RepID=A0A9Q1GKN3_9CARY|nr:hypothetical protein Cgig2_025808 [Carnegiea gigantea]